MPASKNIKSVCYKTSQSLWTPTCPVTVRGIAWGISIRTSQVLSQNNYFWISQDQWLGGLAYV